MSLKAKIKRFIYNVKFKYSPTIPDLDFHDQDSRRNWILFMANKTGRFPVKEIQDKFQPHVTIMTANNDMKYLESQNLIKREKDKKNRSYVIPLFEDSGEAEPTVYEQRREFWLNYGLPAIAIFLFIVLLFLNKT